MMILILCIEWVILRERERCASVSPRSGVDRAQQDQWMNEWMNSLWLTDDESAMWFHGRTTHNDDDWWFHGIDRDYWLFESWRLWCSTSPRSILQCHHHVALSIEESRFIKVRVCEQTTYIQIQIIPQNVSPAPQNSLCGNRSKCLQQYTLFSEIDHYSRWMKINISNPMSISFSMGKDSGNGQILQFLPFCFGILLSLFVFGVSPRFPFFYLFHL